MLTLFAIPRAFNEHFGIIQRNAMQSWARLRPQPEVILFGTDEGTKEVAEEFGFRHIPDILYNEYGTPRYDSIHHEVERVAQNRLLCYMNADIMLMDDFMPAIQQVENLRDPFIMVGQRWNLDLTGPWDFGLDWQDQMRSSLIEKGELGSRTGEDYHVFPKGVFGKIPPFLVGRRYIDGWLLYRARTTDVSIIDATKVITPVHQNHDYSHIKDGTQGYMIGPETKINEELSGGSECMLIIKDRTHLLTRQGLKPARDWWRVWRYFRTALVLHPNWPTPVRFVFKTINQVINTGRLALVLVGLRPRFDGL